MRYTKSWTEALQEVQEQVGVRKVDFVDGVTPDLQEAKPEFEVKYASSKKGPIKVSKFMSLEDAKKFLAQVKGEGMNGIISKGGKPVKEENVDEARKETPAEFLKRGGKIKKVKAGRGKEGKKRVADFKKSFKKTKAKEDELDAKEREEREKNEETVHEAWIDTDARKVERKWSKMDKKAKKKWMDGVMAKAKKDKMPKDEVMDVLDDYGIAMEETSNVQKLKDWGINVNEASKEVKDRVKMFKKLRDKKSKGGWQKTGLKDESVGMQFARKHYQKDKDSI